MKSFDLLGSWTRATLIGECMVEIAPAEEAGLFRMSFAGDTFNTAWYLATLCPNAEISYFTGVGSDRVSDNFIAFAKDAGIDTSTILRSDSRTLGLYIISLTNGERSFSYWRDNSAARMLADTPELIEKAVANTDLVYFSGITLGILNATARAKLLEAIFSARSQGAKIAFDPNLRPKLWSSTVEMTDAIMAAASVSDIVFPSFEDEQAHFEDANTDATIERYQDCGASTIVVKDGPNPIRFLHGEIKGYVIVPPAKHIVDTTAAGDSFNAGFLASLRCGGDIATSIDAGASLAHQVIGVRGALVASGEEKP